MSGAVINAENMSRWWSREPTGVASGLRDGLTAAAWRFDADEPFEIFADPDPEIHIISPIMTGVVDCELFLDGRRAYRAQFGSGMFNLVRAGEQPRAVEYGANCSFLHLYLPDVALQRCAEENGAGTGRIELVETGAVADPLVHRLALAIETEMRCPQIGSRLMIDGLTLQLAGHFVRHWSNAGKGKGQAFRTFRSGLAPWQLKRVKTFLTEELHRDVGLDELTALVNLSPTHLCRAFRQSTGLPPHQWQMHKRVERAKELLLHPKHSITDISLAVGYANPGHFATLFKRITGVSPRDWRRERMS